MDKQLKADFNRMLPSMSAALEKRIKAKKVVYEKEQAARKNSPNRVKVKKKTNYRAS
jgi:hypothetical protein